MGLRLKFNLVLLAVFAIGLAVSGYVSYDLLHKNARDEVLRNAGVMMEAALSTRSYTVNNVRPKLIAKEDEFLPESLPAFAAVEVMGKIRAKYPEYVYREAALNPTNPRNKAVEWEADVIADFRNNPGVHAELSGVRQTPTGPSLFLARPFQIKDGACLACHTTPEMAPAAMVKMYGPNNGFGWKLNEVIGAQVVSVPMTLPIQNANRAFTTFMVSLSAVFAAVFVILNVMLSTLIVRPITRMAAAAEEISKGNMEIPEFAERGRDEMSLLAVSFNRMRRSLEKAISLIDR